MKNKIIQTILRNNLVTLIPVIVAIVYVVGNNTTVSYRLEQIEKSKTESVQLDELNHKIDNFIKVQDRINDMTLNYIISRSTTRKKEMPKYDYNTLDGARNGGSQKKEQTMDMAINTTDILFQNEAIKLQNEIKNFKKDKTTAAKK